MAISHELSSDIASAILLETKSPEEREHLKEIILEVHQALQEMSQAEKVARIRDLRSSSKASAK